MKFLQNSVNYLIYRSLGTRNVGEIIKQRCLLKPETGLKCFSVLEETGAIMNRKLFHLAAAAVLVLAAGCGDQRRRDPRPESTSTPARRRRRPGSGPASSAKP